MASSRKRIIIYVLVLLVFAGAGYGGYRLYTNHFNRYLREARVLESIGDYQKAEEKYKQHLLRHPDDLDSGFDLASCLGKQDKVAQKLEVLKYVESETKEDKKKQKVNERARASIARTYIALADKATELASCALEEKKYGQARSHYEEALSYLDNYRLWIISKKEHIPEEFVLTELITCEDLLTGRWADIAFTYWLEGKYNEAREKLKFIRIYPSLSEKWQKWKFRHFALKVEELGIKAFDKKKYEDARLHWEEALDNYRKYNEQGPDIPRIRYKTVITYFYQKNYEKAEQLARKLAKDFPGYQSKIISGLINDCEKELSVMEKVMKKEASLAERAEDAWDEASKAFDKKDWAAARDWWYKTIEFATKAGTSQSSHYIADCHYNIAICYFNQGRYTEAQQNIMKLKEEYPNYYKKNKEKIDDIIHKTGRWGY